MGVDIPERFILLRQVAQKLHLDKMFQHVGVIAGMKGVAVSSA